MCEQHYFKAGIEEFERIFQIMDVSFPDNEMRTKEKQYELMTTNKYYNIYCFGENREVSGFIVVWDLEECIFIENFATTVSMRGKGLGGELLDFIVDKYKRDVILEVEPPAGEIERRRIGFYERHGFIYNDFDYLMPPIREGDSPLPLKIMSYGKSFDEVLFAGYKHLIYDIVYENAL